MTKRIIVVTYWILTLSTVVAEGQNFDRLLLPREYQGAASRAYRAARDPVSDRSDYDGLRANVVRRYGTDQWSPSPPVGPPRALSPVDQDHRDQDYRDYRDHDYRDHDYRRQDYRGQDYRGQDYRGNDYRGHDRFGNDHFGQDYRGFDGTGYDGDRWDYRQPSREELRRPARLESVLRSRHVEPSDGPCRNGSCYGEPYSSYRPIGAFVDEYELARLDRAQRVASRYDVRYPVQPTTAPCNGQRSNRQQIDQDGNYVSANVFGEPRVFNPDQPIRNLLRYVFP